MDKTPPSSATGTSLHCVAASTVSFILVDGVAMPLPSAESCWSKNTTNPYSMEVVQLPVSMHGLDCMLQRASLRLSGAFVKRTIQFQKAFIVSLFLVSNFGLGMRLVVQRVKSASVTVDGNVVSSIGQGAMALVGLHQDDTQEDLEYCCKRLLACKLWENESGAGWRHGVKQRGLEVLCVSQFTLYGTLSKKHQPDYKLSMKSVQAQEMYNLFLDMLKSNYEPDKIKDGVFGAMMDVSLINDGPVTIVIESGPLASSESDTGRSSGDSS